ncbi:lipoprotein 17-related variable surface protein [Mycoplasmopsis agassizii]|uniref:lipoprotein 17-related variable surface protein n=1 Tax=Mycoplasmopsis agassizii TaxID=33922 RepID=UPI003526D3A0
MKKLSKKFLILSASSATIVAASAALIACAPETDKPGVPEKSIDENVLNEVFKNFLSQTSYESALYENIDQLEKGLNEATTVADFVILFNSDNKKTIENAIGAAKLEKQATVNKSASEVIIALTLKYGSATKTENVTIKFKKATSLDRDTAKNFFTNLGTEFSLAEKDKSFAIVAPSAVSDQKLNTLITNDTFVIPRSFNLKVDKLANGANDEKGTLKVKLTLSKLGEFYNAKGEKVEQTNAGVEITLQGLLESNQAATLVKTWYSNNLKNDPNQSYLTLTSEAVKDLLPSQVEGQNLKSYLNLTMPSDAFDYSVRFTSQNPYSELDGLVNAIVTITSKDGSTYYDQNGQTFLRTWDSGKVVTLSGFKKGVDYAKAEFEKHTLKTNTIDLATNNLTVKQALKDLNNIASVKTYLDEVNKDLKPGYTFELHEVQNNASYDTGVVNLKLVLKYTDSKNVVKYLSFNPTSKTISVVDSSANGSGIEVKLTNLLTDAKYLEDKFKNFEVKDLTKEDSTNVKALAKLIEAKADFKTFVEAFNKVAKTSEMQIDLGLINSWEFDTTKENDIKLTTATASLKENKTSLNLNLKNTNNVTVAVSKELDFDTFFVYFLRLLNSDAVEKYSETALNLIVIKYQGIDTYEKTKLFIDAVVNKYKENEAKLIQFSNNYADVINQQMAIKGSELTSSSMEHYGFVWTFGRESMPQELRNKMAWSNQTTLPTQYSGANSETYMIAGFQSKDQLSSDANGNAWVTGATNTASTTRNTFLKIGEAEFYITREGGNLTSSNTLKKAAGDYTTSPFNNGLAVAIMFLLREVEKTVLTSN